jgi:predicted ArsR family transcriptional regulator
VLETIKELYGSEAIDAIFRIRSEHIIDKYRRKVNGETLEIRLEQLTRLREADGYMSTWQANENGTFVLREANCPIIHAAEGCDCACDEDRNLLENLLDAEVKRTQHLMAGDGACCYEVRSKR